MKVQAHIPPALCAIHNFIRIHDPDEISNFDNIQADLEASNWGELALGPLTFQEQMTGGIGLHKTCGHRIKRSCTGARLLVKKYSDQNT